MCPLCEICKSWNLSSICNTYKVTLALNSYVQVVSPNFLHNPSVGYKYGYSGNVMETYNNGIIYKNVTYADIISAHKV